MQSLQRVLDVGMWGLHGGEGVVEQVVEESGLALDVAVEGVRVHAEPRGQCTHAQRLEPSLGEELARSREHGRVREAGALSWLAAIGHSTIVRSTAKLYGVQHERGFGVTQVALFHSVLGVRPGIDDAATRLRAAGHDVLVVDQYDGRMFDSYEEADGFAQSLGYPELMRRAVAAVEALPDGFAAAGFSNGGGMSEYIATQRRVGGVLLLSGALPLEMLGGDHWPAGVPTQIHYTTGDPFRRQDWVDTVASSIRAAGATVELFDYPGNGHLFTDPSLPAEHQPDEADLLWQRVLAFPPLAQDASRPASTSTT